MNGSQGDSVAQILLRGQGGGDSMPFFRLGYRDLFGVGLGAEPPDQGNVRGTSLRRFV